MYFPLAGNFQMDAGAGYGSLAGIDFSRQNYRTEIIPLDVRLLFSPVESDSWKPYLYAGAGVFNYRVTSLPASVSPNPVDASGTTGTIPAGVGAEFRLSDGLSLDLSGGVNYSLTDNLNYYKVGDPNDAYYTAGLALIFGGSNENGVEVMKTLTNPANADTDGDGLPDGDELTTYKTDPLKKDTDGDGLGDGDEVMKYKTDPLKVDTDAGTVSDGVEAGRGSNPLDPADDVPKQEEVKVEPGKSIVLEGIRFEVNKADIKPESENILSKAYNTLEQNPGVIVEIRGFTDNTGSLKRNMTLSQLRADAVKDYLVMRGIKEERITAKGFGPENPVASNDTAEGRQLNRRVEFFRIK